VPVLGDPTERLLAQIKEGGKAGLHGGMMFEEFGFRYFGPVDGHNIPVLRKYLKMVRQLEGPVLLHVMTRKGHGFQPAAEDPVYFHTPPAFERRDDEAIPKSKGSGKAYTNYVRDAIATQMRTNDRVTVITAAMCQGNKLEPVREEFPERFFDVGICESHAVAFAAGQAKAGMRPIVDIYSTFLQRSIDQIFQEVCLQNLPVVFTMDRAGLTGPDGPTHHGTFDIAYMRIFPNMVVMTPGDACDIAPMLEFALQHDTPCSIRYPKESAVELPRTPKPVEPGKAEIFAWGKDGMILCAGTPLVNCVRAAESLREEGLDIGVISARFVKPLDTETISRALRDMPFVVTVEEGMLMGGFGSAVLEHGAASGIDCSHVHRLGIPDRFVEHGDRAELFSDLKLDAAGIASVCRELAGRTKSQSRSPGVAADSLSR
jgi:1-deoxy-D-xylulose-5-phosphate synthase